MLFPFAPEKAGWSRALPSHLCLGFAVCRWSGWAAWIGSWLQWHTSSGLVLFLWPPFSELFAGSWPSSWPFGVGISAGLYWALLASHCSSWWSSLWARACLRYRYCWLWNLHFQPDLSTADWLFPAAYLDVSKAFYTECVQHQTQDIPLLWLLLPSYFPSPWIVPASVCYSSQTYKGCLYTAVMPHFQSVATPVTSTPKYLGCIHFSPLPTPPPTPSHHHLHLGLWSSFLTHFSSASLASTSLSFMLWLEWCLRKAKMLLSLPCPTSSGGLPSLLRQRNLPWPRVLHGLSWPPLQPDLISLSLCFTFPLCSITLTSFFSFLNVLCSLLPQDLCTCCFLFLSVS